MLPADFWHVANIWTTFVYPMASILMVFLIVFQELDSILTAQGQNVDLLLPFWQWQTSSATIVTQAAF